jgi:5-methyltetrahydropteroyltriglutamate--homocysteine methyltransferase
VARSMNLGMPRIGPRRELKRAIEGYWAGTTDVSTLTDVARTRRAQSWAEQAAAGIESIPSNDFTLYDQVLDTTCLVGAIPARFGSHAGPVDLDTYFSLARGTTVTATGTSRVVAPLEMTKWFDTNYHYLVPELGPATTFTLSSTKPLDEFEEARALGIVTRPVLLGPVTYLFLAKSEVPGFSTLDLLPDLLAVYAEILDALAAAGARWIQLDEPVLGTDLPDEARTAIDYAYDELTRRTVKILVATSFSGLGDNLALATSLPVAGLHVDLVRDPGQLPTLLDHLDADTVLSAGVIDGRNVWRTDIRATLGLLSAAGDRLGDRLWVGPSCSLQHVPHDLSLETSLPETLTPWLAFAHQKLDEIASVTRGLVHGETAIAEVLASSDAVVHARLAARSVTRSGHSDSDSDSDSDGDTARRSPYEIRREKQREAIPLPLLPTTTIGSFPQTAEIRIARRRHGTGELSDDDYRRFCENEIDGVIADQLALGLDVLVHGEPERNDMVQYFGERLDGFATTTDGWVQSYGTRYVRPPILYGDVDRPEPITVGWSSYAQSRTDLPVKGMLTGPVTILQWSFVRDDQPRSETCRQIALAVRSEVLDLEAAGIRIIQVDEPALREGLPLRHGDRADYLAWATRCFTLATAAVDDATQIHTHMCYAEFGDIMDAVVALDVDVISIEAARSQMDLLNDLADVDYRAGIGLGVYDIHSPTVPSTEEITTFIEQALKVLPADQLWVNPDCGLKTRRAPEVEAALTHMVAAARRVRPVDVSRETGGKVGSRPRERAAS